MPENNPSSTLRKAPMPELLRLGARQMRILVEIEAKLRSEDPDVRELCSTLMHVCLDLMDRNIARRMTLEKGEEEP